MHNSRIPHFALARKTEHCNIAFAYHTMNLPELRRAYWHDNLRITAALLVIWFTVTFLAAWFVDDLNTITFLGFPLGFYMASQGSLAIYVVLVWIYARAMNRLDKKYGVAEEE